MNGFTRVEGSQFYEDFIKSYNEDRNEGNFFEVDFPYPEKLDELHNHSPFLLERIKNQKIEKSTANLHDKE